MGKHYILNLYGCEFKLLDDLDFIIELLCETALICGAKILNTSSHKFSPQGVTAILLLAESHISIHTVPERGEAYADIFTCSETDPVIGCHYMIEKFNPNSHVLKFIER